MCTVKPDYSVWAWRVANLQICGFHQITVLRIVHHETEPWQSQERGSSKQVLRWFKQQRACMPVYIEKAEIWSGVTDPWQTHTQTTEYCATQLVLSLKFKLSHAIHIFILSSFSSPPSRFGLSTFSTIEKLVQSLLLNSNLLHGKQEKIERKKTKSGKFSIFPIRYFCFGTLWEYFCLIGLLCIFNWGF